MSVDHPPFGKLKYKGGEWRGRAKLPMFAAVGRMPDEPPLSEEEARQFESNMDDAIKQMRETMKAQFGGSLVDEMFAAIDEEIEKAEAEEPDPREEEREQKRARREMKAAARLAQGLFPIHVADLRQEGPSEQQAAAYSHLLAHESDVFKAVAQQVFDSFQSYDAEGDLGADAPEEIRNPTDLAGQYAVTSVEISREHHDGVAYLIFAIDCPWEVEHGMCVVHHPEKPAAWTTYDGLYELMESDELIEDAEDTPEELLFWAVREGHDAKARELLAAGVDINTSDDGPPLLFAVENLEPDFVRQLLKFGADPNVTEPGKKTTPLRLAKRMYREYGFAPSKKKDKLLGAMMAFAHEANPDAMTELKGQLDEIISLLEAAGGHT